MGEDGVYPPPGNHVDSISCYTQDLAKCNREVYICQQQREIVAETGQSPTQQRGKWLVNAVDAAADAASTIMDDSIDDNGLRSPYYSPETALCAENMSSKYGSFGSKFGSNRIWHTPPSSPACSLVKNRKTALTPTSEEDGVATNISFLSKSSSGWSGTFNSDRSIRLVTSDHMVSCFAIGA